MTAPPLLADVLPEVAAEVQELAERTGDPGLPEQVSTLRIFDRCRCGEETCATFYTAPRPSNGWGPRHTNVDLDANAGMMVLDLVDGSIVCVEVLNREDIRGRLLQVVP
jgi:hypothetical protein